MQKTMILPLFVGFICMFIAMAPSGAISGGEFAVDDKGNPIFLSTEQNLCSVTENGLLSEEWFQLHFDEVNDQVGDDGYAVNVIVTNKMQYWKVGVEDWANMTVSLDFSDPNNEKVNFWGFKWQTIEISHIITMLDEGNGIFFDMKLAKNGSSSYDNAVTYTFQLIVESTNSNNVIDNLVAGNGYRMTIYAIEGALDDGAANGNVFGIDGFMTIITAAFIIGGIAAVTIFGSKVDTMGQRMIFISSTYIVVWVLLSIVMMGPILQIPLLGVFIWLILTAMYMFGVIGETLETNGGM